MRYEGKPLPLFYTDRVKLWKNNEGKTLSDIRRFWRFQDGIDDRRWEQLLGAEVNDWKHMRFMAGFLEWLIYHNTTKDTKTHFSFFEEKLLVTAASIHDQGELYKTDIPAPHKTRKDHKEEMTILKIMLKEQWSEKRDWYSLYIALQAVDDVLLGENPKLTTFFSFAEHLSYIRTGCIAWNKSVSDDPTIMPYEREALQALALEVVPRTMQTFFADPENGEQDMKSFPAYTKFMAIHGKTVDTILQAYTLFQPPIPGFNTT